jgi:DNA-binding transcriptional LysR family regulator
MDLRRFAHIVALADEGSFNAAAQRVHLSQPAFSRSIQAAETELGMQLFVRGGKRIRCTPAGSFVVERLRGLLQASTNLQRDVGMFRDGMVGDLHFGMGTFLSVAFLPALLGDMLRNYPEVRVRAVVQHAAPLLEQLRRHELEFVVIDRRFAPADLEVAPLAPLQGRFYVRAGHPLLARRSVRMEHLGGYGLATASMSRPLKDMMRRAMGLAEHEEVPFAVQCDDVSALKAVTIATDAVMPASPMLLEHELATGALCELPVQDLPDVLELQPAIVSERGRALSPAATYAAQLVRNTALAGQGSAAPPRTRRATGKSGGRPVPPGPGRIPKKKRA